MEYPSCQPVLEAVRRVPALGTGTLLYLGLDRADRLCDLLAAGLDAYGLSDSDSVAEAAEAVCPGRVRAGSYRTLPYPDDSFDLVVVSVAAIAEPSRIDRLVGLGEARRVSRRRVLLSLDGPCSRDSWEQEAVDSGLRRDPQALALAPIHADTTAGSSLGLLWDATAADALDDLFTAPGVVAREQLTLYQLAAELVRQNDAVLELDCDTGAGARVLRDGAPSGSVVGMGRDQARARAGSSCYGIEIQYDPAFDLLGISAHSVDLVVISGRAIREQDGLLEQCERVLKPGGRLLVRVPGEVLDQVQERCRGRFLADQCLQAHLNCIRVLDGEELPEALGHCLSSWITDPVGCESIPYVETVFPAPAQPTPAVEFAGHYHNPWLVHSMILGGLRVRSPRLLRELAERVREHSPADSADYGGALCVLAYQRRVEPEELTCYVQLKSDNPHVLRWQISLRFVQGFLYRRAGRFDLAEASFLTCAREDFMAFGPHLGTKATEGALAAGWLALLRDDTGAAREAWHLGMDAAIRAASARLQDLVIQPDCPSRFEMGDGLRELSMAIDNAAGCANGLHELSRWRGPSQGPRFDIHHRFQSGYLRLYQDLHRCQDEQAAQRNRGMMDPLSWLLMGRLPAPTSIPFFRPVVPGLVSVIIPVYNGEPFIERTLHSVWNQSFPPERIELIVADDGSSDGSLERLEELQKQSPIPMRVVTHPRHGNRGVSATRNLCFRHAAGEFVALLDADDLFLPRRLQATVEYLEAHPRCQALCALGYNVDADGNRVVGYNGTEEAGNYRDMSPDLAPPFTFEQLWEVYPIANSTITVRREALGETGGYPEQMAHQAEDWLLMLKLSIDTPVAFLDEHLIHYTHHAGSYTTLYHTHQFDRGCRIEVFHLLTYWMLQHPHLREQGIRLYRKEYPMIMSQPRVPDLQDLPGILKRAAHHGMQMGPRRSARMLWNTLRQSRARSAGGDTHE